MATDYKESRSLGRTTIKDIAARAGVSIATVSRVLNGHPDVAPATREAVLQSAREGAYVTNRTARALAGGRTGLIGVTVPFVQTGYFMQILAGAAAELYERDARLVLCPTEHQRDREVSLLERVMHGATDGSILVLPSESSEELEALKRWGSPFVVVDPLAPLKEEIPVVTAGHWSGARDMTQHLIALGHRRIGVITGTPGWVATNDRLGGYRAALLAAGLPAAPELVVEGNFEVESGFQGAMRLMSLPEPPTGIFAMNDNMALGAIRYAQQAGLSVPGDLSIGGFDDTEIASATTPLITTVRQPLQEMGRLGAEMLFRLIDGDGLQVSRTELSTRLIARESTGAAPGVSTPRDRQPLDLVV